MLFYNPYKIFKHGLISIDFIASVYELFDYPSYLWVPLFIPYKRSPEGTSIFPKNNQKCSLQFNNPISKIKFDPLIYQHVPSDCI